MGHSGLLEIPEAANVVYIKRDLSDRALSGSASVARASRFAYARSYIAEL